MLQQMPEKGCADALITIRMEYEKLIQVENIGLPPQECGRFEHSVLSEESHTARGTKKTVTKVRSISPGLLKRLNHSMEEMPLEGIREIMKGMEGQ